MSVPKRFKTKKQCITVKVSYKNYLKFNPMLLFDPFNIFYIYTNIKKTNKTPLMYTPPST